jgi:hypothetical protein
MLDAAAFKQRFAEVDEKASCRRQALIGAGRIRSCYRRASANGAAATKKYMNSALL